MCIKIALKRIYLVKINFRANINVIFLFTKKKPHSFLTFKKECGLLNSTNQKFEGLFFKRYYKEKTFFSLNILPKRVMNT
jgi:hypothetical protein